MKTRLYEQKKAAPQRTLASRQTLVLPRKPARGGASARHDFSNVAVFGKELYVDGPKEGDKKTPAPAPPKTEKKPDAKPTCPTNIDITSIEQISDPQFGKNGMLTGIGAVALMTVSGGGKDFWDGISIKETVKQTKNTCGAWARKVCSNESGEPVDFKVGEDTKVLGKTVTKFANSFYDVHMFTREVSVLHQLGKDACEVQCSQTYHCGGKQLGPEFVITYSASKDQIAKQYDVTRITVDKTAKAATP
jgi:hypothetical protein